MSEKLSQCTVLVVDDTEANVDILVDALAGAYEIQVAMDGESALEAIAEDKPDIILLDIMMPGIDGYEVLRRLKREPVTAKVPVIFLTALSEVENKTRGFQLGAVDYITKPFEVAEVQARVKTHLSLLLATRQLERQNEILEFKVRERTRDLALTQDVTIHSLASLAETRDNETGGHILRTQHYVLALAEKLKDHSRFRDLLDGPTLELLFKSAPLHDIGKVGIPDAILQKPGKLTPDEFEIMKTHAALGYQALARAEETFEMKNRPSFLVHAKDIAMYHHERWDGTGYPKGLKGDDIPVSGRIMALADVYDALISKRVYKPAFPHEKAAQIIMEGEGRHFDPDMARTFLEINEEFHKIAVRFADEH